MTKRARQWRLTKTALRSLVRDLDGIKSIVEHSALRAEQMDSLASGRDDATGAATMYMNAGNGYRNVAADAIERARKAHEESMAALEAAHDLAANAANFRPGKAE